MYRRCSFEMCIMMRELFALLSDGKTLSQYDLAERLGATPEAIAARLDFLRRAGYLRNACAAGAADTAKGCGKKCAACPLGSAAPENAPVYLLAQKPPQGITERTGA
jgi:hypothetical protein